ncbi:hypothetical protein SUGI_0039860 [Cryptomeria japonica]|nr:hypothetical protein SUGI_0039860 [Cryptomeria japonica]
MEPIVVGAYVIPGSLIKNPGGQPQEASCACSSKFYFYPLKWLGNQLREVFSLLELWQQKVIKCSLFLRFLGMISYRQSGWETKNVSRHFVSLSKDIILLDPISNL